MARGSPSRTRTGSKRIPCAPSSPRPRACVRTGGDGGSSLLDPTHQLSRLKVRQLSATFVYTVDTVRQDLTLVSWAWRTCNVHTKISRGWVILLGLSFVTIKRPQTLSQERFQESYNVCQPLTRDAAFSGLCINRFMCQSLSSPSIYSIAASPCTHGG